MEIELSFLKRIKYAAIAGIIPTGAGIALSAYWSFTTPPEGGWFSPPPSLIFLYFSVLSIACGLLAQFVALPLIFFAGNISGWRMLLWGAVGTLYLPLLEALILRSNRPFEQIFSAQEVPVLGGLCIVSLLTTMAYIFLVRRAVRAS